MKRKNNHKQLPCPVCGFGRLIDSGDATVSELKAEAECSEAWVPDYFQKCPRCGNEIAIRKVS